MTTTTTTTSPTPLPNLVSTTATSPFHSPHHPIHQHTQSQLPQPPQQLQSQPQQPLPQPPRHPQPQQPQQQQPHHQQPHHQQQQHQQQHQQQRQQQQQQQQQQLLQHAYPPQQQSHAPSPPHLSNTPLPKPPTAPPRAQPSHSDPVLPRGSRVRITGNNRTKWDLIGRIGLVRAAQTLGGWHEVQLDDGGIVRVQRNALSVLELPPVDPSSLVRIESARRQSPLPLPTSIKKRPRKPARPSHANISKLNFASLKRYRSVYNLNVSNDCSRDELVGAVRKHFERTKVNESEVISNFLRHIARRGGPPASD